MKRFYSLGALAYLLVLLSPLLFLLKVPPADIQLNSYIVNLAVYNTVGLSLIVLLGSTLVGVCLAMAHRFYQHPGRRLLHALSLIPLAFPAYVLAFVYLGIMGPSSPWGLYRIFQVQGSLFFLAFILILAFTPYIYFFTYVGLNWVRQSERETEMILNAGFVSFFRANLWPKLGVFIISGQVLVLFETLSDFGAASVINVPVMTTLIYKVWFDLFSFEAAARLALWFSLVIFVVLLLEFYLKNQRLDRYENRDALRPLALPAGWAWLLSTVRLTYILLACGLPAAQLFLWALQDGNIKSWWDQGFPALVSFILSACAAAVVVALSLALGFLWRKSERGQSWLVFSSVGYGIPGTLLAVAFYALLLYFMESLSAMNLLIGLLLAMVYKFLSVGLRPIGESIAQLPKALDETSQLLDVSLWRRWRDYYWPYLKSTVGIGFCLVAIEVIKEMPLSLMLAPSQYPTLSIQVYNYTMEAEWQKAAIPGLGIVFFGFLAVVMMHWNQLGDEE